jgi:hypothetical protein
MLAIRRTEMRLRKLSDLYRKINEYFLSDLMVDWGRTIERGQHTVAWLSTLPSTVNGTELSAQEYRDAISM